MNGNVKSPTDVAELLGVSRGSVDRYIKDGWIPKPDYVSDGGHRGYHVNGRWMVLELFYTKKLQTAPQKWSVFSVFNQKGGVGKTMTVVSLSAALAYLGFRVLVVDMDPQAHAGSCLGVEAGDLDIYDVLLNDVSPRDIVQTVTFPVVQDRRRSVYDIDVLPSSVRLANAENEMYPKLVRHKFLSGALAGFRHEYDFVFIDCPPSLGLLSINSLFASEALIIPTKPEPMALKGITHLLQTISSVKRPETMNGLEHPISLAGVLIIDFEDHNVQGLNKDDIFDQFGPKVFNSVIPHRTKLVESRQFRVPCISHSFSDQGSQGYIELAKELLAQVGRLEEDANANIA